MRVCLALVLLFVGERNCSVFSLRSLDAHNSRKGGTNKTTMREVEFKYANYGAEAMEKAENKRGAIDLCGDSLVSQITIHREIYESGLKAAWS